MTASEAIEWLKGIEKKYIHGGDEFFDNARKIAISTAISALEKQIPKKPFVPWDSINKTPLCPSCHFGVMATQKYCDECGQALDWSDSE